uniref:F-box domain-containing protein n=1 Tax=Glossina brevipalpis TaxID=37001 RepID=A0A1A9WT56_9MUSC
MNTLSDVPVSDFTLPELPTELWIQIFSYLSYGDIQQVKLVDKHWCQLTNVSHIKRKIKLIITAHNVESICEIVERRKQSFDNLQYEDVQIHRIEISSEYLLRIFTYLGPYVHHLKLDSCETLSLLNDLLPELNELIFAKTLSEEIDINSTSLDLGKFPKLKSIDMSCIFVDNSIKRLLLLNLMKSRCEHLELLSLEVNRQQEELILNTLEMYANTLRNLVISIRAELDIMKWQEMFKKFTQLEVLKIVGSVGEDWLGVLFKNIPKETLLRAVALNHSLEFNDAQLEFIAQKWCHSLEFLDLMGCSKLTDLGITRLSLIKHKLRDLNLSRCRISANGLLQGLAEKTNKTLRNLNLSHIRGLIDEYVCTLTQRFPNLNTLSLENCEGAITNDSMSYIFCYNIRLQEFFMDLTKLEIKFCLRVLTKNFERLPKYFPALEELSFPGWKNLTDDDIPNIVKGLPRLRKLNVNDCTGLTLRTLDYALKHSSTLRELNMGFLDLELDEKEPSKQNIFLRLEISKLGNQPFYSLE